MELHQVMKRVQRERIPTCIFLVTFESCILTREVTIGWTRCQVRKYIPKPRQCFTCHRFGHGRVTCRVETLICVTYDLEIHEVRCDRIPKCVNYREDRRSPCFFEGLLLLQSWAINVAITIQRISYLEAKRTAKKKYLKSIIASYANITSGSINLHNANNPSNIRSDNQRKADAIQ